jgi:hypothetical protein
MPKQLPTVILAKLKDLAPVCMTSDPERSFHAET